MVGHVPVHFHDFGAGSRVDKVVPDDIRQREVGVRVPDVMQELIEPGVHALLGSRIFQDVAAGLLPVNPKQVISPSMLLMLDARLVGNSG